MSLFVRVEDTVQDIFEAVKALILANRQRIGRSAKGATRPRAQRRRFNATMSDYRPPEPSASRAPENYVVSVGFVNFEPTSKLFQGGSAVYGVASADGTATAGFTVSTPDWPTNKILELPPQYVNDIERGSRGGAWKYTDKQGGRYFVLPVGPETMLVAFRIWVRRGGAYDVAFYVYSSQPPYSLLRVTNQSSSSDEGPYSLDLEKCFLVGRSQVKEVTVPDGMVNLLRELVPAPERDLPLLAPGDSLMGYGYPDAPDPEIVIHPMLSRYGSLNYDQPIFAGTELPLWKITSTAAIYTNLSEPLTWTLPQAGGGDPAPNESQDLWASRTLLELLGAPVPKRLLVMRTTTYPWSLGGAQGYPDYPFNIKWDITEGSITPPDVTVTLPQYDYFLPSDPPLIIKGNEKSRVTVNNPDPGDPDNNISSPYQRVAAWDWGKPAYCVANLIALGFDPTELVLPPTL